MAVPKEILNAHRNVTLTLDIIHINGHPFLVTFSRNIQLRTIDYLNNRSYDSILAKMDNVINLYLNRKFRIKTILADPEFETFKEDLKARHIEINPTSAKEHVP